MYVYMYMITVLVQLYSTIQYTTYKSNKNLKILKQKTSALMDGQILPQDGYPLDLMSFSKMNIASTHHQHATFNLLAYKSHS